MENNEGRKSLTPEAAVTRLGPRGGSSDRRLSASTERLLTTLRAQDAPLPLAALAATAGRHPNTVREHLDTLVRAGLAARTRQPASGRGRPAWAYEATAAISEASEYAALAVVLASSIVRTSAHPSVDAELAGEDWGRNLVRGRGAAPTTPELARDRTVEVLDDLGFEPHQDPTAPSTVRLTRCPLLAAARSNPSIVCNVHLGMVRGVLSEYGADPAGSALTAFAEPGACLLVVPPVDEP